jgi:hypothetical protein
MLNIVAIRYRETAKGRGVLRPGITVCLSRRMPFKCQETALGAPAGVGMDLGLIRRGRRA